MHRNHFNIFFDFGNADYEVYFIPQMVQNIALWL